jgi:hypothetical protein
VKLIIHSHSVPTLEETFGPLCFRDLMLGSGKLLSTSIATSLFGSTVHGGGSRRSATAVSRQEQDPRTILALSLPHTHNSVAAARTKKTNKKHIYSTEFLNSRPSDSHLAQGFQFYSGRVSYKINVKISTKVHGITPAIFLTRFSRKDRHYINIFFFFLFLVG